MKRLAFLGLLLCFCMGYGSKNEICKTDEETLCANTTDTVKNCLQSSFDKIKDEACRKKLQETRETWQKKAESYSKVKPICEKDVKALCPESINSPKDFKVCLMMKSEKISAPCKAAMNQHIKEHLPGFKSIP
ncbi:MAG: hypothetical protein HRU19_24165 [Pseudobacteriovorax sp.]|nr:hypothetical protein [Pseudobacteriovorax sp.]